MKNLNKKMKTATMTAAALSSLVMTGCAVKTKILDVSAVSMTHPSIKEGESLQEKGPVTGQFCMDTMNDKGSIGLIDEVVRNAQKQHNVDFITNAVVFQTGNCVGIEGTGHNITSAAAAPSGNTKQR